MKLKFLMASLLGLISMTAFAQKSQLNNAQDNYDQYTVAANQKLLAAKAQSSITDAKTAIDKAAVNEKTANMPQTLALKAAIYAALAARDTIPATASTELSTAQEALQKAKDADTKGEFKKLIDQASTNIAQYNINAGIADYKAGKYDAAYHDFDNYRQIRPDDTTAIFYTGLAASNEGVKDPKYFQYAIENYSKLLTTNYSKKSDLYQDLTIIYLNNKDTTNALKVANEGVSKYPGNAKLRDLIITTALQSGKEGQVLGNVQTAITADPKNKVLYYYEGYIYNRAADDDQVKMKKATNATTQAAFRKSMLDGYAKAVDAYKKAVDIDPDYFDANLNLGSALMQPAIDTYNQAVNLAGDKQKEYDAMRLKADAQFDTALPYLQKAIQLNPKSSEALRNLWSYYRGKYDPAHAADNKQKAIDLKKQIDDLK